MGPIRVGICGFGTVGSGTFTVLQRNGADIAARVGRDVRVTHVGVRRGNLRCETAGVRTSRDVFAVVRDPEVDIVVELIGGCDTARELVIEAIAAGKHVVTANKALIALHGNEIFAAAGARGVTVAFEAAVGGGIPIIKAIREGLAANRIEWVAGIINGTGNYILSEMREKGRSFADGARRGAGAGLRRGRSHLRRRGHRCGAQAGHPRLARLRHSAAVRQGLHRGHRHPREDGPGLRRGARLSHQASGHLPAHRRGYRVAGASDADPGDRLIANVNGVMNAPREGRCGGPDAVLRTRRRARSRRRRPWSRTWSMWHAR
jgi:homoserine dehydrogenase